MSTFVSMFSLMNNDLTNIITGRRMDHTLRVFPTRNNSTFLAFLYKVHSEKSSHSSHKESKYEHLDPILVCLSCPFTHLLR